MRSFCTGVKLSAEALRICMARKALASKGLVSGMAEPPLSVQQASAASSRWPQLEPERSWPAAATPTLQHEEWEPQQYCAAPEDSGMYDPGGSGSCTDAAPLQPGPAATNVLEQTGPGGPAAAVHAWLEGASAEGSTAAEGGMHGILLPPADAAPDGGSCALGGGPAKPSEKLVAAATSESALGRQDSSRHVSAGAAGSATVRASLAVSMIISRSGCGSLGIAGISGVRVRSPGSEAADDVLRTLLDELDCEPWEGAAEVLPASGVLHPPLGHEGGGTPDLEAAEVGTAAPDAGDAWLEDVLDAFMLGLEEHSGGAGPLA